MSTTPLLGSVEGTEQLAERLIERLLAPRETVLKHRAPRSDYVHQLRRDIRAGKAKPVHMLLAVLVEDLKDGIPLATVLAFTDELRDALTELAAPAVALTSTKTMRTLLLNEQRAQAERDGLEIELHADPANLDIKRRFLAASKRYETANAALLGAVSRDAAALEQRYPGTRRTRTIVTTRAARAGAFA